MKGTFLAVVCLLGLHLWIQGVAGAQLDPSLPGGRCRCRKVTMDPVGKHMIKKIELIPSRVYCPMTEIVISTKNNQAVCIDPEAKWFKNMFPRLIQKKGIKP
ncbi:C-X-C motif chemokine 10-like [Bufo bufo]|uniref:C-X-C motif chemokine 10-like n=1 Tax=Bufo bufo TaxID=8384 RepID=UPI001ABDA5BB|nr:C-X-C motif chemokine 10-like [Bufo bufo]